MAVVSGDFLIPCFNYTVTAEAERGQDTVYVRMTYEREPICAASVVKYAYRATIQDLEAGTYLVRVSHYLWARGQGGGGMTEVARATVEVR